jgi:hypothetical protein
MSEVDRLPSAFTAELSKIYASNARSGVIPAGRRENVLIAIGRVTTKYAEKIKLLRAAGHVTDAVERQLARIENDAAKQLPNAA